MMNTESDLEREIQALWAQNPPEGLDGVWHPQTGRLQRELGANGLDLNNWWCLTPADWVCSACGRTKPEIAKKGSSGALICHLVEHHDHMDRYIRKRLGELVGGRANFVATADAEIFAKRSSPALEAFEPTIICEDCNNADALAKKKAGAHPDFSFTPSDIRAFVKASPNRPHQILAEQLAFVWARRKAQLASRMELADKLCELASSNFHWYENADHQHHSRAIRDRARFCVFILPPPINESVERFVGLSASKTRGEPNIQGWRRNKRLKSLRPPNEQEVQWIKVTHPIYASLPEDWKCPWCQRNKVELIRPSKQFDWSFAVSDTPMLRDENLSRISPLVCQDCRDVRAQLAKEAKAETVAVRPTDVSAVIYPQPNSQHALKEDSTIDVIVAEIVSRAAHLGLSKP